MGLSGIGPTQLIIVLIIALIVLGPKRLPEAGRSLGRGMREFKDSLTGGNGRDADDSADGDAIEAADPSSERAPRR